MDLRQQVVLITGASSGIGYASALAFGAAGARLVLTGRRHDRLAELAERVPDTTWLAGDIADPELPETLLQRALDTFGRLDVAVNNAGLNHDGRIEDIDIEAVCRMVRVNVEAHYRVAYTVLNLNPAVGGV
jgi:NADP-dependent 3-hydroxy acid dehydrogenase YdfG